MHGLIFIVDILSLLASSNANAEILRLDCETYANFSVVHEDKKLNSHAFATLFDTQQSKCEYECSLDSRCKSINFKREENICELHDKSADDARDRISTITSVGWTFYSPSYKEILVGISCRLREPCGTSKKCIDTCDCPGYKCTDRNEVYSNCNEAMSMNGNMDGFYRIQLPNMQHNASIECKSVDGQPTAVLHHDMEQKVKFRGYEKAQSYRKKISYVNNWSDIMAIVDSSINCSQHTRISCYGMVLISNKIHYGALVDRDGNTMDYFGGGPEDGRGCKCGITNSCVKPNTLCNCDRNVYVWYHDEGYVKDKRRLPLTEVRFGDNGDRSEIGVHTIGPLICKMSVS